MAEGHCPISDEVWRPEGEIPGFNEMCATLCGITAPPESMGHTVFKADEAHAATGCASAGDSEPTYVRAGPWGLAANKTKCSEHEITIRSVVSYVRCTRPTEASKD